MIFNRHFFLLVIVILSLLSMTIPAWADTKAIKDLCCGGVEQASNKMTDVYDRLADPNNREDVQKLVDERNKAFAKVASDAVKAGLNVPGTTAKPPKPGLWSLVKKFFKKFAGLAFGTSGTSATPGAPDHTSVGVVLGENRADSASYSINGVSYGDSLLLPYHYVDFSDSFGRVAVATYSFDVTIESDLRGVDGAIALSLGDGCVMESSFIDLSSDFGFSPEQYFIGTVSSISSSSLMTLHIDGWAAQPCPEPATILLLGLGLVGLAGLRRKMQKS